MMTRLRKRTQLKHHSFRTAWVAALALVLLTPIGCARGGSGSQAAQSPGTTPASSAPASPAANPSTAPSPARHPSAADQLAPFFTAAQRMDTQIRNATSMVNGQISNNTITVDSKTKAALKAIVPLDLVGTLPRSLPSKLAQPVVLVFSELVSRRAAFRPIDEAVLNKPTTLTANDLRCLGNGHAPSVRFANDLAAARSLASASTPVPTARPDSRAAAELRMRLLYVNLGNLGCDSCGGFVETKLRPIVWKRIDHGEGSIWDGTIGPTEFHARYQSGKGWQIYFNAC